MPSNTTIALYQAGRNGERGFLLWTSISGMSLPGLCEPYRYRLTVHNGARLLYACAPESAEFILHRLHELLEHTPGVRFTACLKCQVGMSLALIHQDYPDPAVQDLETLNSGLDEITRIHAWLVKLLGQAEADAMLAIAYPAIAKAKADFEAMIVRARPEPDRTTAARYLAPDQTKPATLTPREKLRLKDDRVALAVDSWDDYECSSALLLITEQRKIDRQRARDIRRAEEAKVGKNGK